MRRIKFVVFLFIILVWSCKELPLDPTTIDPVFVTINASSGVNGVIDPVGQIKIKIGESKIYKVIPNDGYIPYVTVDGLVQSLSVENTFEVKADNTSLIKEVKAEFPIKGYSFLQKDIFYEKCINIIQNGEIVDVSFNNYPDITKCDKVIFTATQMQVTSAIDGVMRPQLYFLVDPTHISIAGTAYEIKILDEKNFIYISPGFYNLKPAQYEHTFWRP